MKFDNTTADHGEPLDLYCSICLAYVQERTKHCGPCNRCCSQFDHHCKWLNNCIGSENYQDFRSLTNWFLLTIALNLGFVVAMWATGLLKASDNISQPVVILLWIQGALSAIVFIFDLQLILFHVWIVSKGITTFEYIGFKREESVKKQELKDGEMTIEEYKDWRREALTNPSKPKSRTITRRAINQEEIKRRQIEKQEKLEKER